MRKRYLSSFIKKDLDKKMVFLAGARQVGKTTLAKQLLGDKPGYLNWDISQHREAILNEEFPVTDFWVFDEIHKYRKWRNYLKGIYDQWQGKKQILVTGSAKLDHYRFGGDSLQGRYHFYRLHQFSIKELGISSRDDLVSLLTLGGFPEPFLSGSEKESKRWSREYKSRILYEEVNTLEHIMDLGTLERLVNRLPDLVGSPLSINALREDLQVSHKTVANWMNILERLYLVVRLPPFGTPILRAVKKEQKHYHYDWTQVQKTGPRFENMIAIHLLKWVHFMQDSEGCDIHLKYFRDIDGREVDFVLEENNKPVSFIEVKESDDEISKGLKYLKERFGDAEAWQISLNGKKDYMTKQGIRVCPAGILLNKYI